MTQGDLLAMIAYRIQILPLVNNLKREIPDITQPWYTDDTEALGTFAKLENYFDLLLHQGPGRGECTDHMLGEYQGRKSVLGTTWI